MNEDFLRWVGEKKLAGWCLSVCVCVCVCVCVQAFPGIAPDRLVRSGPGWHGWTRRKAGTTMVPVGGRSAARGSWHVPPRESLQKKFARTYRSNGGHRRSQTRRSHVNHPNLSAFGVAVPEGSRLHALVEESFFDVGSSGSGKL